MARPSGVCRVASPSGSTSTVPPSRRLHQRASSGGSWQSMASAAMPAIAGAWSVTVRSPPVGRSRSRYRPGQVRLLGADQRPGPVGDPGEDDHGPAVAPQPQPGGQVGDVNGRPALADLDGADTASPQDLAEALEVPGERGLDPQGPPERAAQGRVGGQERDPWVEL